MDQDSTVGIVACHRLDSHQINSQWQRNFPHSSRPTLGPTQPSTDGYWVSPENKAARVCCLSHPQLLLRSKKEQSYTSTPPLSLHGLFWGELHLFLFYSHTHLGLPNRLFPAGFPTKTVYTFSSPQYVPDAPSHSSFFV